MADVENHSFANAKQRASALRSSFPPSRPVFPFLFTGPNWVWTSDWITGTNHYLDH